MSCEASGFESMLGDFMDSFFALPIEEARALVELLEMEQPKSSSPFDRGPLNRTPTQE